MENSDYVIKKNAVQMGSGFLRDVSYIKLIEYPT